GPWLRSSAVIGEHGFDGFLEHVQRVVNISLSVRRAEEPRLARVGVRHSPAYNQLFEDGVVRLIVAGEVVAVLTRALLGEVHAEHAGMPGKDKRDAVCFEYIADPLLKLAAPLRDLLQRVGRREDLQRLLGGGDADV